MIEFKVGGLENLDKMLKDLPQNIENRVLQNAVTSAIREGAKSLRQAAPRATDGQSQASLKYGKLSRNIRVRSSRRDRAKGQRGAYIHTGRAFWGFFLEKGTRYISARPWFLPTFKKSEPMIIKKLAEKLKEGIEKEFRR